MSQEQLAALLGVTFQQVQKYERGVNRIAASRLWDVCNALGLPIGRMFEGIDAARGGGQSSSAGAPAIEDMLATAEGAQLVSLFASIKNRVVRRRVVDLVRAIASEESAER